jgi:hypothetical protein
MKTSEYISRRIVACGLGNAEHSKTRAAVLAELKPILAMVEQDEASAGLPNPLPAELSADWRVPGSRVEVEA